MKIGIIGAGFTGLSAGLKLAAAGHRVTLLEREPLPGGLAIGYQKKGWEWTLEEHYHHWFFNDDSVLNLAKQIHYPIVVRRPKTSVWVNNQAFQLDSPLHVLRFPLLNAAERVRMAATLGFLRFNPNWKALEGFTAHNFLRQAMGKKAYGLLWEPQLKNKFGRHYQDISLAWFWARISKRTPQLVYPEKGFLSFARALVEEIKKRRGTVVYNQEVSNIKKEGNTFSVVSSQKTFLFDQAIVTLPTFLFSKIMPQLPPGYVTRYKPLKGLGAINLVLRLKEEFFNDGTYWLSVCDVKAPVLAVVEHTHFMDKSHYNNEHLVYVGNYLDITDKRFSLENEELLTLYDPFLTKLNLSYRKNLIGYDVFRAPFAQPVVPVNYSGMVPPIETPIEGLYLANMQQVYPWDRGTNYAVELGERVADGILLV